MAERFTEPVTGPSAWTAADLANDLSWSEELDDNQVDEVLSAVRTVKRRGLSFEDIRKEDFELSSLGPTIYRLQDPLENGLGVALLRGLPVQDLTVEDCELMAAGLAAQMGSLIVQDKTGTMMGHVLDRGLSQENISVAGFKTREPSTPHCDTGDLLGLVCIHPAKSGGVSMISSAMAIYNAILRDRPAYLEALYTGFHYNIRGNGPPGEYVNVTRHRVPVYDYYRGRLSCRFHQQAIRTAPEWPGVEPLTRIEVEAVNYLAGLAMDPQFRFDFYLKAGDLLLLNNNVVLHNRSGFVDHPDSGRKRQLLRLWINMVEGRELSDEFADHYNTGPRQGLWSWRSEASSGPGFAMN